MNPLVFDVTLEDNLLQPGDTPRVTVRAIEQFDPVLPPAPDLTGYEVVVGIFAPGAAPAPPLQSITLPVFTGPRVDSPAFVPITAANTYTVQVNVTPIPAVNNVDTSSQTFTYGLLVQAPQPVVGAPVSLQAYNPPDTSDEAFWAFLKGNQVRFKVIHDLVKESLCAPDPSDGQAKKSAKRLPFVGVEEYSIVKFGVEAYLMALLNEPINSGALGGYLQSNSKLGGTKILPYYNSILERLDDALCSCHSPGGGVGEPTLDECYERFKDRLVNFSNVELIWSYWMEQGMLVQTMNAIGLRFQNVRHVPELDALSRFDTSPLLPVSNLLWGYIQDEQHSLSLQRRAYEYDHEYGLVLLGRAVPQLSSFDSRSRFLEAFNTLLNKCAVYYRQADQTTLIPDAFPVLNALREVNLLLAEGNHNAYHNLTTTARIEMLTQQYLLAQPEMREFLGGRIMVPYAEPWMDRVDTVRTAMGWGDTSITYFADLANYGELLLLSVRYGHWSQVIDIAQAANWANAFRNEVMRYIHSYRTVTGVDLSADAGPLGPEHFTQPSLLMQSRMTPPVAARGVRIPAARQRVPAY